VRVTLAIPVDETVRLAAAAEALSGISAMPTMSSVPKAKYRHSMRPPSDSISAVA